MPSPNSPSYISQIEYIPLPNPARAVVPPLLIHNGSEDNGFQRGLLASAQGRWEPRCFRRLHLSHAQVQRSNRRSIRDRRHILHLQTWQSVGKYPRRGRRVQKGQVSRIQVIEYRIMPLAPRLIDGVGSNQISTEQLRFQFLFTALALLPSILPIHHSPTSLNLLRNLSSPPRRNYTISMLLRDLHWKARRCLWPHYPYSR